MCNFTGRSASKSETRSVTEGAVDSAEDCNSHLYKRNKGTDTHEGAQGNNPPQWGRHGFNCLGLLEVIADNQLVALTQATQVIQIHLLACTAHLLLL